MSSLADLQSWFTNQCNGDWEHQGGVTIETLDNPGWLIIVSFDTIYFKKMDIVHNETYNNGEEDFVEFSFYDADNELKIFCSPQNLEKSVGLLVKYLT